MEGTGKLNCSSKIHLGFLFQEHQHLKQWQQQLRSRRRTTPHPVERLIPALCHRSAGRHGTHTHATHSHIILLTVRPFVVLLSVSNREEAAAAVEERKIICRIFQCWEFRRSRVDRRRRSRTIHLQNKTSDEFYFSPISSFPPTHVSE